MEMRSGHCGHMHTGQWSLSGRSGTTGPQSAGNRAHVAQGAVRTLPAAEHPDAAEEIRAQRRHLPVRSPEDVLLFHAGEEDLTQVLS